MFKADTYMDGYNQNNSANLNRDINTFVIGFGKGRLFKESLFSFDFPEDEAFEEFKENRLPICEVKDSNIVLVAVRHADMAWMLKHKWIDVGIGSSLWFINEKDVKLKKAFGLDIKNYKLSLISKKGVSIENISSVATRFVNIAERYFKGHNLFPEIIKMDGCHEIAISLGQVDAIIDVVETGRTIRKMGLIELDSIYELGHEVWLRNDDNYDSYKSILENLIIVKPRKNAMTAVSH